MEIINLDLPLADKQAGCGFLHSVSQTYPMHIHNNFYELFLVMKGKAVHYVNDVSIILEQGSFVFMRPNDKHKYESFNGYDFELLSIGFSVDNYHKICLAIETDSSILSSHELPPMLNLHSYDYNDISNKLLYIGKLDIGERKRYFLSILPYIIYKFTCKPVYEKQVIMPEWLSKLIEEMSKRDNYVAGVQRMQAITYVSQEHLDREFNKYVSMTPTEFINIKRMDYAAELLLNSNMSSTDICFTCGYNNLSHFYHTFKKHYGCSPKEFINSYYQNNVKENS